MEAEKLMIGDWADFAPELEDPPFAKTITANNLYMIDSGRMVVKPIPLTPEILEKNGFEKHTSSDTRMFLHHDDYRLSYYPERKHFTIYNQIDGSLVQRVIVNVHELQHALKLCGIDKKIII